MSGEQFRDPATIRLLFGCNPAGPVTTCHCKTDRCNDKSIGGSGWPEYELPVTKPDDGGGNGLPGTNPGEGGSNKLSGNGTKPGDGSKSSFGHVTSPFGHVIMAVALLVTIVIGYLL